MAHLHASLNIATACLLCPFPSCWTVCLGSCQVLGNSALSCMLTADCCSSAGRRAIQELKLEAGLWACLVKTLPFPLSCLPHLPFCLCSSSDQRALECAMPFRPAVLYKESAGKTSLAAARIVLSLRQWLPEFILVIYLSVHISFIWVPFQPTVVQGDLPLLMILDSGYQSHKR